MGITLQSDLSPLTCLITARIESGSPPGTGYQNREKEEAGKDYGSGQLFACVFDVHEEENDDNSFDGSDEQRNDGLKGPSSQRPRRPL